MGEPVVSAPLIGARRHRNPQGSRVTCATGKLRYPDKLAAKIVLAKAQRQDHGELRAYRCEFCRGWHLTSQAKGRADA